MTIGGVRTNNQDDIAVLDTVKILRSGAGTKSGFEAISGRRMAYTRAGIDVIVTKTGTYKLLHEEGFFIGAAAGCDATERARLWPLAVRSYRGYAAYQRKDYAAGAGLR